MQSLAYKVGSSGTLASRTFLATPRLHQVSRPSTSSILCQTLPSSVPMLFPLLIHRWETLQDFRAVE